jgi:thiamine-phosphate diphosphorylase
VPPRVILITDPAFGDDTIVRCIEAVAHALPMGALAVQLRDKQRALVSLRVFASRLRLVTRTLGARLLINGDPQLARDVGADGVHLGQGAPSVTEAREACGPGAWVSVSAHSDAAVEKAVAEGASAVLVSPVFSSRPPGAYGAQKEGRGLEVLRAARRVAGPVLRVYALGGVDADNARACADAGADGVAAVRALLENPEPARVARAMNDALGRRC